VGSCCRGRPELEWALLLAEPQPLGLKSQAAADGAQGVTPYLHLLEWMEEMTCKM